MAAARCHPPSSCAGLTDRPVPATAVPRCELARDEQIKLRVLAALGRDGVWVKHGHHSEVNVVQAATVNHYWDTLVQWVNDGSAESVPREPGTFGPGADPLGEAADPVEAVLMLLRGTGPELFEEASGPGTGIEPVPSDAGSVCSWAARQPADSDRLDDLLTTGQGNR
ncbi:hypothetical protein ACFZAG_40960 [Streptomyces sp. NPDC012403]|uniref:hypothetical protein n=1 Tax=unclassified Streptomyces TaxID=2593676 RepID=UPI001C22DAB9|nr:hypothetical protein [Streptomyces sp. AC558_RSS880]